jgi:uncharacterized membrane protein
MSAEHLMASFGESTWSMEFIRTVKVVWTPACWTVFLCPFMFGLFFVILNSIVFKSNGTERNCIDDVR